MPYFGGTNHLAAAQGVRGSAGPRTSFYENFSSALDQQMRVDAEFALEAEFADVYQRNLERAAELSGQAFEAPQFFGTGPGDWQFISDYLDLRLGGAQMNPRTQQVIQNYPWVQQFEQTERVLAELKGQFPEVKTFQELMEEVQATRAEIEGNAAAIASRAGPLDVVGGFAGGLAGSFTFRDPSLLVSNLIPGGGATFARRMVIDGLIGAGVEGGVQFGHIQPTREALGEAPTNPWVSIALAGAGSAAFRGALEGSAAGYRALERQLFPDRVRAREFSQALDAMPVQPRSQELLNLAETADLNPAARAAAHTLQSHVDVETSNPYGRSPEAIAAAKADLEAYFRQIEDLAPSGTQTAVSRFIPREDMGQFAPTPQALAGRLREPELYRDLDVAETRVAEAETRVAELEGQVNSMSVGDAVQLIDEASGARVKAIEAELENTGLPRQRRAELEQELDTIVETLGVENIRKVGNDALIKPSRQLKEAKRSLAQARKVRARLFQQAKEVESTVGLNEPLLDVQPTNGQAARDLSARLDEEAPTFYDQARAMVDAAKEELPITEPALQPGMTRVYHSGSKGNGEGGRWVSTNKTYASDYRADLPFYYLDLPEADPRVNNADIPEQGIKEGFTFNFELTPEEAAQLVPIRRADKVSKVSIGGTRMAEDFTIDIDEAGTAMSVRQILDDLDNDDAMLKAMEACSL